jgi:hypothetical protein
MGNILGNVSSNDLEEFLGRGDCRGYIWEHWETGNIADEQK